MYGKSDRRTDHPIQKPSPPNDFRTPQRLPAQIDASGGRWYYVEGTSSVTAWKQHLPCQMGCLSSHVSRRLWVLRGPPEFMGAAYRQLSPPLPGGGFWRPNSGCLACPGTMGSVGGWSLTIILARLRRATAPWHTPFAGVPAGWCPPQGDPMPQTAGPLRGGNTRRDPLRAEGFVRGLYSVGNWMVTSAHPVRRALSLWPGASRAPLPGYIPI